jgi:hypothetical protein
MFISATAKESGTPALIESEVIWKIPFPLAQHVFDAFNQLPDELTQNSIFPLFLMLADFIDSMADKGLNLDETLYFNLTHDYLAFASITFVLVNEPFSLPTPVQMNSIDTNTFIGSWSALLVIPELLTPGQKKQLAINPFPSSFNLGGEDRFEDKPTVNQRDPRLPQHYFNEEHPHEVLKTIGPILHEYGTDQVTEDSKLQEILLKYCEVNPFFLQWSLAEVDKRTPTRNLLDPQKMLPDKAMPDYMLEITNNSFQVIDQPDDKVVTSVIEDAINDLIHNGLSFGLVNTLRWLISTKQAQDGDTSGDAVNLTDMLSLSNLLHRYPPGASIVADIFEEVVDESESQNPGNKFDERNMLYEEDLPDQDDGDYDEGFDEEDYDSDVDEKFEWTEGPLLPFEYPDDPELDGILGGLAEAEPPITNDLNYTKKPQDKLDTYYDEDAAGKNPDNHGTDAATNSPHPEL